MILFEIFKWTGKFLRKKLCFLTKLISIYPKLSNNTTLKFIGATIQILWSNNLCILTKDKVFNFVFSKQPLLVQSTIMPCGILARLIISKTRLAVLARSRLVLHACTCNYGNEFAQLVLLTWSLLLPTLHNLIAHETGCLRSTMARNLLGSSDVLLLQLCSSRTQIWGL